MCYHPRLKSITLQETDTYFTIEKVKSSTQKCQTVGDMLVPLRIPNGGWLPCVAKSHGLFPRTGQRMERLGHWSPERR